VSEAKNSEIGEPIDRPSIYRTLLIAFVIWSAHFAVSYAGVLIFPNDGIARIIAIVAGLIAIAALLVQVRRLPAPRSPLALGALGLAGAGVIFGTFPALVG
jgi:hypothetical protein|tara:strand:- start:350 stop:652 length:303 start_codon:yes stop_codon:yes gene_type:complete